ncbi:MAG: glutamate--tRNA ligase [Ligilactobacillus agilis]|nr:glutamate--tRNA ligase [Ligilactobacillus agilis]
MAKNEIRVRYAPSPTGHLHIGNARTALFNYLFARRYNGKFIIRIEDTDLKRNIEDGERSQLDNLKWMGLDWDEGPDKGGKFGPYRQSERKDLYEKYVQQLMAKGFAYKSYMTEEELTEQRERQKAAHQMPHYEYEYEGMSEAEIAQAQADAEAKGLKPVIRFRVPKDKVYEWDDIVKGHLSFDSHSVGGDFVIMKRDGMPTYNFAVVVDDHLMKISHVFRGDDHVSNTPKQMMIYEALGWDIPKFGHMALIINSETGKKLSKRDESVLQFIEQYRDLGYLPEAMDNFIILLGWSPVGEDEIFSLKEFVKMYDEKRLSKSPAAFDGKKLSWINNQYMKNAEVDTVFNITMPLLMKAGLIEKQADPYKMAWMRRMVEIFKRDISFGQELVPFVKPFVEEPQTLTDEAKAEMKGENVALVLRDFRDKIAALDFMDATSVLASIKAVQKDTKVKGRNLWMPLRIAVTHETHGPQLPESIELIGQQATLARLDDMIEKVENNSL